jgi:hypothetical protein
MTRAASVRWPAPAKQWNCDNANGGDGTLAARRNAIPENGKLCRPLFCVSRDPLSMACKPARIDRDSRQQRVNFRGLSR